MLKQTTSLLIILLLVGVNGLPLLSFGQCEMSCCQTQVSCCSDGSMSGCGGSMVACEHPLMIPLVVAPIVKVEQQVERSITDLSVIASTFPADQDFQIDDLDKNLAAEPPPAYLPPLLI